jgi:hypothetical protein
MSTYAQLLTPIQDAEIARKHLDGMRLADLGREFGVYPSSIRASLRRSGITPNNYTHRFNAEAFDDLTTEHACYWLGFIFADGSIAKGGFRINLKRDDAIQLERLRTFLRAEQTLAYDITYAAGRPNERVALRISDRAFGRKLAALGIESGRPHPERAYSRVPGHMLNHWFRGLFDGDGCAHKTGAITFLSQEPILILLQDELRNAGALTLRPSSPTGPKIDHLQSICRISFNGVVQCRRIADYLYRDATVWMERKRTIIDNWTSQSYLKA